MTLPALARALLALAAPLAAARAASAWRVTVAADEFPREQSLVTFALPATTAAPAWRLRDAAGATVPVQAAPDGTASFVLARLAAGARAEFTLDSAPAPTAVTPATAVSLTRDADTLVARVGTAEVFRFHAGKSTPPVAGVKDVFRRAGYLHPVLTPAGRLVTDDYPADHRHHHGIWWAWTKTVFEGRHPDFWNVGAGTGRVDLLGVDRVWSGPVHGGFEARLQSVDVSAQPEKPALDETWRVRLYAITGAAGARCWVFDLESSQRCASASPLALPAYRYGGLGVRGHAQWNGPGDVAKFLPSNGLTDRLAAHESHATWCHLGGLVDGVPVGLATLADPRNFRAPEPLRVNDKNPFLCFAPSQAGDWEMVPGRTYVWRYRFLVQDGVPDPAWLEARWRDYAHPATATLAPL